MLMQTRAEVVVVGGGLAGLAAAAFAARGGAAVTLLERSAHAGGRARTRDQDGYLFNVGAHALYRGGPGMKALNDLGVAVAGRRPPGAGLALMDGVAHPLPAGPRALLVSRLLGLRSKLALARLLPRLAAGKVRAPRGASVDEWLRAEGLRPDAAGFLLALARVTTYSHQPELFDAAALVGQLRLALREGVLYLDGGWQSLVDGLAAAARDTGARLEVKAKVEALDFDARGHVCGVRVEGTRHPATAVVLAAPPEEAARLAGERAPALRAAAGRLVPARAATLDLGLRRLPRPDTFALGIDRPLYFSVHSATARLAPGGGALVHLMRYLGSDRPAPDEAERELEASMDAVQPGWRAEVQVKRFVPELVVAHDLPRADRGGVEGRTPVAVPEVPGLFLAGDWVGAEGLLADASLASGRAAGLAGAAEAQVRPLGVWGRSGEAAVSPQCGRPGSARSA